VQVILEGNLVNLDVTSPGATLALALMHLKTNDAAVAASFAVPATHFALDHVKPELLQLRVLARGLVMWDAVQPTRQWVLEQLPDLIKVGHTHFLLPWMSQQCKPCSYMHIAVS
jgi:anaphase-promoting complex subunit 1